MAFPLEAVPRFLTEQSESGSLLLLKQRTNAGMKSRHTSAGDRAKCGLPYFGRPRICSAMSCHAFALFNPETPCDSEVTKVEPHTADF